MYWLVEVLLISDLSKLIVTLVSANLDRYAAENKKEKRKPKKRIPIRCLSIRCPQLASGRCLITLLIR